jgi:N-acetylglucosaminyl-diphospho-decaprenol L-rhamnosyltransferase
VAVLGVPERAAHDQVPRKRPEPSVRHGDVQGRARGGDLTQPRKKSLGIGQVLEHVVAQDGVEGGIELVKNGGGIAEGDLVVAPSGRLGGLRHDLDAREPFGAGGAQWLARAALAAAHVQHPAERPRQPFDEVGPLLPEVARRLHCAGRLDCPAPVKDLAVVIVNYRTADDVSASVASIERTAADVVAEIVVVDNASGDGSAGVLRERHPGIRVLEQSRNRGFAAGVNAGFRATSTPHVLVLNPDTEVRPRALAALRDHLQANPDVGVVGPVLLETDGAVRLDSYKQLPSLWSLFCGAFFPLGRVLMGTRFHPELRARRDSDRGGPVPRICGSAMAIRRAAFDEAGPMDEGYFLYFEEIEWQRRAADHGWGIEVVPESRVVHAIQGGEVKETWPLPYVDSAFRYMRGRGLGLARIARVLLVGFALSRLTLRAAAAIPPLRAKAARMDAGYAELETRVRAIRAAALEDGYEAGVPSRSR